ncbi:ABC transporter permease OS=Streptomyces rutgersensis OX=53451 GN=F0345_01435 PE=4 SV=1 [Streptomyces diastaticus subsp. diastaticus]
MWKGLKALEPAEARARVADVHRAAQRCRDTAGLLSGSAS